MNIQELTKFYVKNFIKGKESSITRKTYQKLIEVGQKQGVNLSRSFFLRLSKECVKNPDRYANLPEDEMNRAVVYQMQAYIKEKEEVEASHDRDKKREKKIGMEY